MIARLTLTREDGDTWVGRFDHPNGDPIPAHLQYATPNGATLKAARHHALVIVGDGYGLVSMVAGRRTAAYAVEHDTHDRIDYSLRT